MTEKNDSDFDELDPGVPAPAEDRLNARFRRGFTIPPALRMNSVYGKYVSDVICSSNAFKPVTGITGRCTVRGPHDVHEDECGNRWQHDERWNRQTLSRTLEAPEPTPTRLLEVVQTEILLIRAEARVI